MEAAFVSARYEKGKIIFVLQNGTEVSVPISAVTEGLVSGSQLEEALSFFWTKNESDNRYQQTISDLDAIRDGASKGATALQEVPEGYAKTEELEALENRVSAIENSDSLIKVTA